MQNVFEYALQEGNYANVRIKIHTISVLVYRKKKFIVFWLSSHILQNIFSKHTILSVAYLPQPCFKSLVDQFKSLKDLQSPFILNNLTSSLFKTQNKTLHAHWPHFFFLPLCYPAREIKMASRPNITHSHTPKQHFLYPPSQIHSGVLPRRKANTRTHTLSRTHFFNTKSRTHTHKEKTRAKENGSDTKQERF